MRMKRTIIVLMGLAAFVASVPQVQAWLCCRHCCKCSTYICCTPYNAFSPCCCGSICCNGCCPFSCGPCCAPCCPTPCCGPSLLSSNCCESEGTPCAPGYVPPQPMPNASPAPNWAPPAPAPMVSQAPMWNMPAVQQTGYYPGYYPAYQPQGYWPVAVPSYWYGR